MEYKGMKEDERLISVTPSKRQIAYQNMEYFCFIHFYSKYFLQEVSGDQAMNRNLSSILKSQMLASGQRQLLKVE